ncbi:MAG: response regulator [Deltaproteobacteria bacterium]|nr:response regulator [Deltaproteobacteria bacterium]
MEDISSITRTICHGVVEITGMPFGWVAALDATRRVSSKPSHHSTDGNLLQHLLTDHVDDTVSSLVGWIPVGGMVLSMEPGGDDPDWIDAEICRKAGLSRLLLQPIAAAGITEGFIMLGGGSDPLTSDLAADVRFFATSVSLAIQQAMSFAELKRSEKDIVKHRTSRLRVLRQWASTIDAMDSMFVITDTKGFITRLNRSVADRLELKFQDIIGQEMSRFFGDLPQIEESKQGLIPKTSEVTVPFIDGIYELSCFPNLGPEGERIGMIFIFRDVTEEKRIREHLLEAEKLTTLSAVLSGVAHEMNNPLAAVMGFAQLAQELTTEPQVQECLSTVLVESEHVSRIVRNLLAFARRSRPFLAPVSMSEVIAGSIDLVSYEMKVANIDLTTNVPDDLADVLGDEQQLKQAIVAMLLFLAGSIRRGAGKGAITASASHDPDDRVRIEISGDGVRMDPKEISDVFVLPSTGAPEESANRVGLAMAYGTVTQHGGMITASGKPDGGFVFAMDFPAVAEADQPTESRPEDILLNAKGLKALVVDDDEVAARLVSNVLRMAGATVDVVSNGKLAWESATGNRYDLLVTDLRMPGLDGRGLLERLVEDGNPLARRAVLMTGDVLSIETTEFLESSGLPCITKPFTLSAVRRTIRDVLEGPGESEN